ncbi:MAG: fructose bisphosphate aldolase [Planktomarina sp.]|nr:fructose bisphosphate aldolase [Planktomarina sp.]
MPNQEQIDVIKAGQGFIAALDQSGGSTPKALAAYGITPDKILSDNKMYQLIHTMRSRIVMSPDFTSKKVIGAILFEDTINRSFQNKKSADYLWEERGIVPFLKVDKGLAETDDGVQLMKEIPELDLLLSRAVDLNLFGTKMRSVIKAANATGISKNVKQQFTIGTRICENGLIPILEPEIAIGIPDKVEAEIILKNELLDHVDALPNTKNIMLKLTLPEIDNHYRELIEHKNVLSVVALSGGYKRAEANNRLMKNKSMIASFSRALTEGLSVQQSDAEFNKMLGQTIDSIYQASIS